MEKAHIVDGNNFFSRVFFAGGRDLTSVYNQYIQFRRKNKGKLIFTFDTTKSTRRLAIYPEYKAGRKSSLTEEEYEQFKKTLNAFINVLKNTRVTVLEGEGYEADDYIAILSKLLKRYHVHVHSTDKDFLQLVSDRVTIVKPHGDGTYLFITPENFQEVVGVYPDFYLDFKSMVGDPSDNIPGIKGIGETTAARFINMYGSYAEILLALRPKLNAMKKADQPSKTELKLLEGEPAFNLAKQLIDLTVPQYDNDLKILVSKKVTELNTDLEKVLEILTEIDSEDLFDTIKAACQTFQN